MKELITNAIENFITYMEINLPDDVAARLDEMAENETEPMAKEIYGVMKLNIEKAKELGRPICQDTGMIQVFARVGASFKYIEEIENIIIEASRRASKNTPLRPNAIMPFTEKNTGDNIAVGAPFIEWEIVPGDKCELCFYMAGGGSSLPGKALVLMPSKGIKGIEQEVVNAVLERGVNACPPLFVGVGISACADTAALLSKKALLRPINSENKDDNAARFERELFEKLNALKIGPNALHGSESVLGVNVEIAAHHPATLAMGVSFGCWATRRGSIIIGSDGTFESATHAGWRFR